MSGAEQQPSSRAMRLVLVGIVLTVLLGVVAFVSRGHVSPTGSGARDRGASQLLVNVVFTLLVLGMIGGTFVLLYVVSLKRAERRGRSRMRGMVLGLVFFAVVTVGMILGAGRLGSGHPNRLGNQPLGTNLSPGKKKQLKLQPLPKDPDSPSFNWELAAGVIALVLGASVTALIASKRRRSKLVRELTLAYELAAFLDQTLDDIRGEADPRRAVIAAYARMEAILSAHGLPRTPSEAPLEYLSRVLLELRVSERAVRQLTALYERAKFSEHEIDVRMKEDAIDALESLRDDLRAIDRLEDKPPLPQPSVADLRFARTLGRIRSP